MKRPSLLPRLAPVLTMVLAAAAYLGLPQTEAQAAPPNKGGGFDEGGYIMGVPGGVGIPVVTSDFYDLNPSYGWGFGGGWMFARGKYFKATVGGVFEHAVIFPDNADFNDFGVHILRFMPEARIGLGSNKVWGYGLAGGGPAFAIVHWRNNNPVFNVDTSHMAPGFNMQLGGGVQGMIWKNLFLGGEVDVDLGFFFEDDPNDFGNDNDDTFVIHQVTLEFLIGWYF
ncbi:MAG: hypothetical protein KC457_13065 [Myxococcales bacterium]|nr:hypothetical protein [Myxococcales bacterium]